MLRLLSLATVIAGFVLLAVHYGSLPPETPSHFDANGEITNYAPKGLLWVLAFLNLGLYLLLAYVGKVDSQYINYPVAITPENQERQHANMINMLEVMRLVCCLVFTYIIYAIIYTTIGRMQGLGSWFIWATLGAILLPIGYFCWRAVQLK